MKIPKGLLPVCALFSVLSIIIFLVRNNLEKYGLDVNVLIWGNIFLFLLSCISFFIQQSALRSGSTQVFTRYFYLSFVTKFILVAVTVLLYSLNTPKVNKASVLVCMGLYLVYVFIEISFVLKSVRNK